MNWLSKLINRELKTVHFSVDDTIWLLENLGHFQYASLFEQPVLAYFRNLHNQFGITVSFYCFGTFQGQSLSSVTDQYRDEFIANSDWLKFGFHAANDTVSYIDSLPEQAGMDYAYVMGELQRIVGTQALDYVSRIHGYKSSQQSLMAMAKNGLQGCLCGDSGSENQAYFLNHKQQRTLWRKGHYYSSCTGLFFLETAACAERDEHPAKTMGSCLRAQKHVEIFTHEWAIDDATCETIISYCQVCKEYGCQWVFTREGDA